MVGWDGEEAGKTSADLVFLISEAASANLGHGKLSWTLLSQERGCLHQPRAR